MARVPVGDDALLGAAGVALAVFILSGGVYAGVEGPVGGTALVLGLLGLALGAVLVVLNARRIRNRSGS